jgi:transposase
METPPRKPYLSDVSDDEWAVVAPYLTLMDEAAPQRRHDLREVFDGLRRIVRGGLPWRLMPIDLPQWTTAPTLTRSRSVSSSASLRTWVRTSAGSSLVTP